MEKPNIMKTPGKRPISTKGKKQPLREDDLFGNMLKLDPELQKELDEQGLVPRFVDAKKLYETNGYHAKGWTVYKRKATSGTMSFKFGNDPDGIVRRGSLILAVKTKELVERHRDYLRQQAEAYDQVIRRSANNLRRTAREGNVDSLVDESYEDEQEN